MNLETIIDANFKKFKKDYSFENGNDNDIFEVYCNSLIANHYHYLNCVTDFNRFDLSNVGGNGDSGIDGIFIRINGVFVYSIKEIDSLVSSSSSLDVEFIFVQTKNKVNMDSAEIGSFFSGIKNFISEKQFDSVNEKINDWIEIKNYIFKENIITLLNSQPKISAFYVYKGTYKNDAHINGKIEEFKNDVEGLDFSKDINVFICDGSEVFKLIKETNNNFEAVVPYNDSFELNDSENVGSSFVLYCKAIDIVNLMKDEEGRLRRELFNDNVRDFQGETNVNKEISNTINKDPSKFCLLNNGITIVCKKAVSTNRKITLTNPQIVNGCQTCTTIFNAYVGGNSLETVELIVKVIATEDSSVMNSIIKGTNTQNIVYDETFEITREFHKQLEEYVISIQSEKPLNEKIYYERRANQYALNDNIAKSQLFNLTILTQAYASTFLVEPQHGFEHVVYLLNKFKNQLFLENDLCVSYYTAALLYLRLDALFKMNFDYYHQFIRYRCQIMSIFIHSIAGRVPNLFINSDVEKYCNKLLDVINSPSEFKKYIDKSVALFNDIKNNWINEKGPKFAYAIKNNASFVYYMLDKIGFKYAKFNDKNRDENRVFKGTVIKVNRDRNGLYYCYIKSEPNDVFVHQENSPKTNFSRLINKEVLYKIISRNINGDLKGTIINVLSKPQCN